MIYATEIWSFTIQGTATSVWNVMHTLCVVASLNKMPTAAHFPSKVCCKKLQMIAYPLPPDYNLCSHCVSSGQSLGPSNVACPAVLIMGPYNHSSKPWILHLLAPKKYWNDLPGSGKTKEQAKWGRKWISLWTALIPQIQSSILQLLSIDYILPVVLNFIRMWILGVF